MGLTELVDDVFTYQFQNHVIILMQIMEEKDRTYTQAIDEIDSVTTLITCKLETKH